MVLIFRFNIRGYFEFPKDLKEEVLQTINKRIIEGRYAYTLMLDYKQNSCIPSPNNMATFPNQQFANQSGAHTLAQPIPPLVMSVEARLNQMMALMIEQNAKMD
ncbi:hypothetical protein HK096_007881 [Nowakowskiella sp. JEL0078]|nr:hypothetical protein HK096_007881 [Nowakowskiella sp. JEL0078]